MANDNEVSNGGSAEASSSTALPDRAGKVKPAQRSHPSDRPPSSPLQTCLSRLPEWVQEGLTVRSLKMLVRSWIVCWAAFILLLPGPSLRALGQAAFFGSIVAFIVPSNMPTALFLMSSCLIVFGASLGWAWSTAALASGLRARSEALLASQVQRVRSGSATSPNPDVYFQDSIFRGQFLDIRATAVVGVYFVIGTYAMAWLQATRPKLKVVGIFASILMDINCAYGPLFPTGYYRLGEVLFYPMGCAMAIGVAAHLIVFPESFAYGWQLNTVKLLDTSNKLLALHSDALYRIAQDPNCSLTIEAELTPVVRKMQAGMVMLADSMRDQTGFLHIDVSYSHFSPHDLKAIFESIRSNSVRLFGLDAFLHILAQSHSDEDGVEGDEEGIEDQEERAAGVKQGDHNPSALPNTNQDKPVTLADTHVFLHVRQRMLDNEAKQNVQMRSLLKALSEASHTPIRAADASMKAMRDFIDAATHHNGKYDHAAWVQRLEFSLESLEQALETFISSERLAMLKPYEHMFIEDAQGAQKLVGEARDTFRRSARPLYVCFVFVANLTHFLEALKTTHAVILQKARKRPRRRVRLPTLGLRKLFKILTSRSSGIDANARPETQSPINAYRYDAERVHLEEERNRDGVDDDNDNDEQESTLASDHGQDLEKAEGLSKTKGDTEAGQRREKRKRLAAADRAEEQKRKNASARTGGVLRPRDPDALPPTNILHSVGRFLSEAYNVFWSPEGMFALRYAIVSFALWLPSVVPSSAHFAYVHRSIWALIMAQTGLAVSGGELMFSLITRLIGTLAGLVLGMLYWYMSCGDATRGNAYGLGAVTAVGFIPLMWLRLFAPPAWTMCTIMLGVTTVLAVGYSWIDTHLFLLANSGKGVDVAWRRALLVLIGMAAAIIVTVFPRPPSTRRNVRHGFAKGTEQLARLFSTIIEGWIDVEMSGSGQERQSTQAEGGAHASELLEERERERREDLLQSLRPRFLASQAVLGVLDRDIRLSIFDLSFHGPWPKRRYEELMDIHARLLQAIAQMAGALVGLDERWRRKMLYTTAILDPLTISDTCVTLSLLANSLHTGSPLPHAFTPLLETTLHHQGMARAVQRALSQHTEQEDQDALTLDMLRDPLFTKHVAGVMAHLVFVRQLDRFHAVVRELVGEQALPGYDAIKTLFDKRMVEASCRST